MRSPAASRLFNCLSFLRSAQTCSGLILAAACLAANASSTARASVISRASLGDSKRTRAPRLAARTTSPSCSRRAIARRTVPRLALNRLTRSSSISRSFGRKLPLTMASLMSEVGSPRPRFVMRRFAFAAVNGLVLPPRPAQSVCSLPISELLYPHSLDNALSFCATDAIRIWLATLAAILLMISDDVRMAVAARCRSSAKTHDAGS